jgi:predicted kinase
MKTESLRQELILTVGLPYSGKTTWAVSTGWPIVNPDSIRRALHGQRFYAPAEPFVWACAYLMVEALFRAGNSKIIVDATNITAKRRELWGKIHAGYELKILDTSPKVCIERARLCNDTIIIPVIERQAKEWDLSIPECWRGRESA